MLVKSAEYIFHRIVAATLILSVGAVFSSPIASSQAAGVDDLEQQIEEKARELKEINEKIEVTQKNLNDTSVRGQTLQKEVQRIDGSIKQVTLNIRSSEVLIDKLGLEILTLQDDIYDKEVELEKKRHSMSQLFQKYQVLDGESLLLIFLKNDSLADSVAEAQVIEDLNTSLLTEMQELQGIQQTLSQSLNSTSQKKSASTQEALNLKAKKNIIESEKERKARLLSETKNEEQLYQQQLSELEKQQQAIGQEIAQIEAALRAAAGDSDLPAKIAGVLSQPLQSVFVTQNYGATSFAQGAYSTKFHNGVDYRAAVGTPILAAADGVVRIAGDNGRLQYGRHVMIDHGNNLSTMYAHMSQQAVSAGETVKRGQVIGYAGATGYAFGSHLHFGVYWTPSVKLKFFPGAGNVPIGITINPFDYL
ncbi:MAG: peptidoglycan DD-metalloendopeptidase family protein [Candidatus Harrisonbacteria bacterium]|nr:peptidoglycan DD-metalloendopeptidase family protein [Candidatus Harrisonbacteria bacterium]